jgi:hypothetical protein
MIRRPLDLAISVRRSPCSRTASATLPIETATPTPEDSADTSLSAPSLRISSRFG